MKASFESIQSSEHASFIIRKFEEERFSAPYHFHPEYELTLIVRGVGKRYVGTHMNDYAEGDLVLLGCNLPHCWKTAPGGNGATSVSIVVHFQKDFLGKDFFSAPETRRILQLLNNSRHGIQFTGDTKDLQLHMQNLLQEPDTFKRLISLLALLQALAASNEYVLLDKQIADPA